VGSSPAEVTSLLNKLAEGDQEAAAKLVPLVYDELRRIAESGFAVSAPITRCKLQPWWLTHNTKHFTNAIAQRTSLGIATPAEFFRALSELFR
jgi:hypothetical protein